MKSLIRIFSALSASERIKFIYIVCILVLSSLMESAALMILVPYIGMLSQSEEALSQIYGALHFVKLSFLFEHIVFYFSLFFAFLIILKSTMQLYANYLLTKFPFHYYHLRTRELFYRYLNQDYTAYVDADISTLLKHCSQTSLYATEGLYQQLQLLSYSFVILFIFSLLLYQDFWGSLGIIFLFSALGQVIYRLYKKPVKKMGQELVDLTKRGYQIVTESLRLFKEVRLYRKESFFLNKFDDTLSKMSESYRKTNFYSLVPNVLTETLAILVLISIVLFVYSSGELNSHFVAILILYAAAGRRVLPAINQAVSLGISLQHREESLSIFHNELDHYDQKISLISKPCFFEKTIKFQNVDFAYTQKTRILEQISFELNKQSSVAFVGPSGGGKSTIADILIGLLEPTKGSICVDGKKIKNMMPLQHCIGFVPQSILLLNDTISSNIAFGEAEIDTQKMNEVIRVCCLEEFIKSLPMGVETVVGDQGVKLSGGQRQRIGIARALYKDPEIIIFDEATASLDTLSEMIISESIREMKGRKTIIAIAHRLQTVKHFDMIYVLDKGRIIASGKHEVLLKTCQLYQSMALKKQIVPCAV